MTKTNLEPVDGTTVDERWEHAQSTPERVSDWTHGQDHVQVGANPINKETVHGQRCRVNLLALVTPNKEDELGCGKLFKYFVGLVGRCSE